MIGFASGRGDPADLSDYEPKYIAATLQDRG
jgi:hypothetical protein